MKTKDEIREWLDKSRGVNNFGGSISVEDVVEAVYQFQLTFQIHNGVMYESDKPVALEPQTPGNIGRSVGIQKGIKDL